MSALGSGRACPATVMPPPPPPNTHPLVTLRPSLAGTPAVARTFDSYNQWALLKPGLLGRNKIDFKFRMFEGNGGQCRLPRQLPLLLHRFAMVRRTKAQVMRLLRSVWGPAPGRVEGTWWVGPRCRGRPTVPEPFNNESPATVGG